MVWYFLVVVVFILTSKQMLNHHCFEQEPFCFDFAQAWPTHVLYMLACPPTPLEQSTEIWPISIEPAIPLSCMKSTVPYPRLFC